ncbi:MAG: hypothetical protein QMC62_03880 [Alteromonadaceae bacterium]
MEEFTEREKQKFGDIWVRARHNAMAHLISSRKSERKAFWIDAIVAIFILIPIGSAFILPLGKLLSYYFTSWQFRCFIFNIDRTSSKV